MHFLVRYVDFCSFLRGIRILVRYVDFCSFLRGIRILVRYVDFCSFLRSNCVSCVITHTAPRVTLGVDPRDARVSNTGRMSLATCHGVSDGATLGGGAGRHAGVTELAPLRTQSSHH
jgi:hypothetical protein